MFVLLLYESFRRQRKRKVLAGAAILLGMAVITGMLAVATDIGEKMSREMRAYGANLVIYPEEDTFDVNVGGINFKPSGEGAFLQESDLPKIKRIFWRNNILGFAPFLSTRAVVNKESDPSATKAELIGTYFAKVIRSGNDSFTTGVRKTHPWWRVEGQWPADDSSEVLIGVDLAQQLRVQPGDRIQVDGRKVMATGVLTTGGAEDHAVVSPLLFAQQVTRQPGAVRRVFVSAMTKPEDAFARENPATMSPQTYERWYCSPYANSIALQLQEAIPRSRAEQIRQVAKNEGKVLSRISGLMWLISLASVLAFGAAVSSAMATTMVERRREVALMKSLGAGATSIAALFLTESAIIALIAVIPGFFLGVGLARWIGFRVFNTQIEIQPVIFPIVLMIALTVAVAASAASIRRAMRLDAGALLRGGA